MSQVDNDSTGDRLNASTVRRNRRCLPTPLPFLSLSYLPNLPSSSHRMSTSGEGNCNNFNKDKDQEDIPHLDLPTAGLGATGAAAAGLQIGILRESGVVIVFIVVISKARAHNIVTKMQ
ncbi:hypothetical protein K435DRAFT_794136 [Dendrothele bispora CBS 962.96]|uniref:Uncharacterized protein n=1 Tax=Dendrothele bispora (strain CBS 962.96) TaxID=1314807 RepID=A0A4V4HGY6_DENBC|nr:hypothetical protein K435DRAFT_794136 [Dendrothele bispora CBS 962.96]